jgi:predicted RND superfamily exporter protein
MDYLDKLATFADWMRGQPEVRYVQAMDLTLKRLRRNMHGDDPAYERMPTSEEEAAQYLLLYEMSLPYGASLTNEMTLDKSALRMIVGLNHSETADHLAFQARAAQWLDDNAPELAYPGTSTTTIMADLSRRDSKAMLSGTVMALIVISLTIMIVFRSLEYGVLSFLVNIMPATLALGLWGLFVGQVGISVSMVFAASLGIIVDYCLHFLSKYRRAKQEQGLSAEQAIEYAFSTVGVALLVTTAVLGINFAILGLSNFRINIDMGVLTAMTIVFALLAQLFYLPALLLALERFRKA